MKVSRRRVFQGGALAVPGAVMGDPLRAWAQLKAARAFRQVTPISAFHPGHRDARPEIERMKWFREARFGMFIHWDFTQFRRGAGW